MKDPRNISIQDYTYALPAEKIALVPLPERDQSKLLIYKDGLLQEDRFCNIANHIPGGSLVVFNNSKVINARILFRNSGGSSVELFCLDPNEQHPDYSSIMSRTGKIQWKCLVGGASKWKEPQLQKPLSINNEAVMLKAVMIEKSGGSYVIEFSWTPDTYSFAEVIENAGDVPLPPYIKRNADKSDTERYQTIYALQEGSVAAPTAGLHFTDNVFHSFAAKNIEKEFVTLHVGAGTFKPVKSVSMQDHEMHAEWIDVDIDTIRKIRDKKEMVIATGTTSLRTIETLYWLGVKSALDPKMGNPSLGQWDVYDAPLKKSRLSAEEALGSLISWMNNSNRTSIFTQTQLLITPGYTFRIASALITNFHQPQSTLLLLVAAAAGNDWKKMYAYALEHDFRFLSYGDGNLIFIRKDAGTD